MNDDVKKALERQAAAVAALREEQREAERGEQEAWRQTDAMRVERDALRAQLAEAVGVLGYLVRFVEAGGSPDADDLRKARAFLAKHPEGK